MKGARLATAALLFGAVSASAAEIKIVNNNRPNEGFNDTKAATPVGGNTGRTIGEQRLKVFEEGARIWGGLLPSNLTVNVIASFEALPCSSNGATLGAAGTTSIHADFPGAPIPGIWYPQALANKLAGTDQEARTHEISARFSSTLGSAGCSFSWYYGLDNNHGAATDLLEVLLHELGHGLGFQSFVDEETGEFFAADDGSHLSDAFTHNLYDSSLGQDWASMDDAVRKASAIGGALAWTGPAVTRFAGSYMNTGRARLLVRGPSAAAGTYPVGTADFGRALGADVTGAAVQALDGGVSTTDGCETITNTSAMAGNIAIVDRGTCNFTVKVKNAQVAGAIGVVVANNGSPLGGMTGSDPTITIPSVIVSQGAGAKLKAGLPATVSLGVDETLLAGADDTGRLLMYAPDPVQPGSSISHFDTTATPNLLMEPAINGDLARSTTDATLEAFKDLGWFRPSSSAFGSWLLASSARAPGAGGAFFTTDLFIGNSGPAEARVTLKFLGNGKDGRTGAEKQLTIGPRKSLTYTDVLSSAFDITGNDFGAILVTGTTTDSAYLTVVGQTSTPAAGGGTFGQSVPAAAPTDLVVNGTQRSIVAIREDDRFRTNLILANATERALDVEMTLITDDGRVFGPITQITFLPLEMRQIGRVVQSFAGAGTVTSGTLVLSTPTVEGAFAAYASVIDNTTNDPRTLLPGVEGPSTWYLPATARAGGAGGAFYTTDVTIGNRGAKAATVTLKFVGNGKDGRDGLETIVDVPAGRTVTYSDVLGSLFGLTADFGAIKITSSSALLNILSQTSTPGSSGTFGQSVPVAGHADLVTVRTPKRILGVREDAAFRTNLILFNVTNDPVDVDLTFLDDLGNVLGTQKVSPQLQPLEMRQLSRVLPTVQTSNGPTTPTVLGLAVPTANGRVAAYASVIDNKTNDPRTLLPK